MQPRRHEPQVEQVAARGSAPPRRIRPAIPRGRQSLGRHLGVIPVIVGQAQAQAGSNGQHSARGAADNHRDPRRDIAGDDRRVRLPWRRFGRWQINQQGERPIGVASHLGQQPVERRRVSERGGVDQRDTGAAQGDDLSVERGQASGVIIGEPEGHRVARGERGEDGGDAAAGRPLDHNQPAARVCGGLLNRGEDVRALDGSAQADEGAGGLALQARRDLGVQGGERLQGSVGARQIPAGYQSAHGRGSSWRECDHPIIPRQPHQQKKGRGGGSAAPAPLCVIPT